MDICFWCKRPKDNKDADGQPEYFDYEPCLTCNAHVNKGIMVVQVTEAPNGDKPIGDGIYPTGKWVVIDRDRLKDGLSGWVGLDDVLKSGNMFVNEDTWKKMKLPN